MILGLSAERYVPLQKRKEGTFIKCQLTPSARILHRFFFFQQIDSR